MFSYILRSYLSLRGFKDQVIDGRIQDQIFILSNELNIYFRDPRNRNYIIISISIALDLMVITQCYKFSKYGSTYRLLWTIVLFFGIRGLIQQLVILETPTGSIWKYPGWFTTFVAYPSICDYWYSGHVGFCFINYLEFMKNGEIFWGTYSFILMIFTSFFIVVMRGHYAIDIPSGLIFGHYIWM